MKSEVNITGSRLRITRVFDAPRAEVFGWWASAEKLRQWSGCKETVSCEVVMDFRTGGSFTQKMRIAVQGKTCEFSLTGIYDEIVVPERISYRADLGKGTVRVTVEFFDQGGQTKVVLTQEGFGDPESPRFVAQGTTESFDKLDTILAAGATAAV